METDTKPQTDERLALIEDATKEILRGLNHLPAWGPHPGLGFDRPIFRTVQAKDDNERIDRIAAGPQDAAARLNGILAEWPNYRDENGKRDKELSALRSDLAAVRRVLGTES